MRYARFYEVLETIYEYYPRNVSYNERKKYESLPQAERLRQAKKMAIKDKNTKENLSTLMKDIFSPQYALKDCVDLRNDVSYLYYVLLHKNQEPLDFDTDLAIALGGCFYQLEVVISYLAKYYFYFVSFSKHNAEAKESENAWIFRDIFCDCEFEKVQNKFIDIPQVKMLDERLEKMGFSFVPKEILTHHLEDIETQCSNFGQTLVYDCIFSNVLSIHRGND